MMWRAGRFDALIYGIEPAYLLGQKYTRALGEIFNYLEYAGMEELEYMKEEWHGLMKYILEKETIKYYSQQKLQG